jgi:GxxExxY protein
MAQHQTGDFVFPDLSFKIIGAAFEVYNQLGSGHREKIYQNALSVQLKKAEIKFEKEIYYPLIFKGEKIGKNYFDFLVDDKVIVEIKRSDKFSASHFEQLNNYLKVANLKLGILISFTSKNVRIKRVVNLY